jgi:hypothetical protein
MPKFRVENTKGLSVDEVKHMYAILATKAKSCAGQEMIYELCQEAQDFLYKHNKPPAKSFHDQMMENQRLIELGDRREDHTQNTFLFLNEFNDKRSKIQDLKLLAEIDEAIMAKQKIIHDAIKKERQMNKREHLSSHGQVHSPKSSNSKNNSESESPAVDHQFTPFTIQFTEPTKHTVNCVKSIRYNKDYAFRAYRAIDLQTNDMYHVYEWTISLEKNKIYEKSKFDTCLTVSSGKKKLLLTRPSNQFSFYYRYTRTIDLYVEKKFSLSGCFQKQYSSTCRSK